VKIIEAYIAIWNGSDYIPKKVQVLEAFEIDTSRFFIHLFVETARSGKEVVMFRVSEWQTGAIIIHGRTTHEKAKLAAITKYNKLGPKTFRIFIGDHIIKYGIFNPATNWTQS